MAPATTLSATASFTATGAVLPDNTLLYGPTSGPGEWDQGWADVMRHANEPPEWWQDPFKTDDDNDSNDDEENLAYSLLSKRKYGIHVEDPEKIFGGPSCQDFGTNATWNHIIVTSKPKHTRGQFDAYTWVNEADGKERAWRSSLTYGYCYNLDQLAPFGENNLSKMHVGNSSCMFFSGHACTGDRSPIFGDMFSDKEESFCGTSGWASKVTSMKCCTCPGWGCEDPDEMRSQTICIDPQADTIGPWLANYPHKKPAKVNHFEEGTNPYEDDDQEEEPDFVPPPDVDPDPELTEEEIKKFNKAYNKGFPKGKDEGGRK